MDEFSYQSHSIDDEFDAIEDDTPRERITTLPHGLNSPLVLTKMWKLTSAITRQLHPSIRPLASLAREFAFLTSAERRLPPRPWNEMTHQDLINMTNEYLAYGRDHPVGMTSPRSEEVYTATLRGLESRGGIFPVHNVVLTHEARCTLSAARLCRRQYDQLRRMQGVGRYDVVEIGLPGIDAIIHANGWAMVEGGSTRVAYAPLDWFLSVLDRLEEQSSAMLAAEYLRQPAGGITSEFIRRVARWQVRVLERYGNDGYPVLKAPEAMFKCYSSSLTTLQIGIPPVDLIVAKYVAKERNLGGSGRLTHELRQMADELTSVEACCDAASLIKLCGYPFVDPSISAAGSRNQARTADHTKASSAARCVRMFSHLILKNFIAQNNCWPHIEFSREGSVLHRLYRSGRLDIVDRQYPLEDWDSAELVNLFDFMYHEDYLSMIADKACCAGLDARPDHYAGRLSNSTVRRLILTVLESDVISTKSDVEHLALGTLPAECYAMDLSPEEKEFKPAARMFTLLHPVARRALSIIQENVKALFFPLLPYTSMAMGASETALKLHSMTASTSGRVRMKIESDLTGWNLRFRRFLTMLVGHKMDRMAGVVGVFGGVHRFFEKCEIAVMVPDLRIEQLEPGGDRTLDSDVMWRHDDTGKEGIAQRFWSVITAVMVYMVFYDEPYPFEILGQGDNQVVVIDFGILDHTMIATETGRLSEKFETIMGDFNHEAKPEEFIISASMLTYSKDYYCMGRRVASAVKFGAKVRPIGGEFTNSLEDAMGSIYSAAIGSARNLAHPLDAWRFGMAIAEQFLYDTATGYSWLPDSSRRVAEGITHSRYSCQLALGLPACLGGFPISSFSKFLIAGNPDPLGEAIAGTRIQALYLHSYRNLEGFLLSDAAYRRPDLTSLLSDPYGIPLRLPATAEGAITDAASRYISACANRDISELAEYANDRGEELRQALVTTTPLHPLIARDLYDISAPGRAARVAGKFSSNATMSRLVMTQEVVYEYGTRSARRGNAILLHILSACSFTSGERFSGTTFEVVERLRLRWETPQPLEGVSLAQPLDYLLSEEPGPGIVCVTRIGADMSLPGPWLPYLGSRTKERRDDTEYRVASAPGIMDLGRLVASYTAGGVSAQVRELYDSLARSRCAYGIDELATIFPRTIGGVAAHRYDSMRGDGRIAPMGNPTISTHSRLDTDDVPSVSSSDIDWPLAMQAFMSYVTVAAQSMHIGRPPPVSAPQYLRIVLGTDGLRRLGNEPRSSRTSYSLGLPAPLRSNPLLYVPALQIVRTSRSTGGSADPLPTAASPLHQSQLLSGLFFTALVGRTDGLAAAELGRGRPVLDAAACVAMGATKLCRAAIDAVALAVCWFLMWTSASREHRFHEPTLLDNLSRAASGMLREMLLLATMDLSEIIDEGYWDESMGTGGIHNAVETLRRRIRGEAQERMRMGAGALAREMILPELWGDAPIGFTVRFPLALLTFDAALRGAHGHVGICKRYARHVAGRYAQLTGSNQAYTVVVATGQALFDALREFLYTDWHDVDVHRYVAPLRTYRGGITACWRSLRSSQMPEPPLATVRRVVRDGTGTLATMTLADESGDSSRMRVAIPMDLPEAVGRTHAQSVGDRFGRVLGRRSTVGQVWAGIIDDFPSGTLIVGSGQGGVAAYLASLGRSTVCLDLASSLPPDQIARLRRVPELSDRDTALWSPLMLTTSGDWFEVGERALALHTPRAVIIDIESGTVRYGLRLLTPLTSSGYRGLVAFRVIATMEECVRVLNILSCSAGIGFARGYACTRYPSERACPVIFLCVMNSPRLTDIATTREITCGEPREFSIPVIPRLTLVRSAVRNLSGGMFSSTSLASFVIDSTRAVEAYTPGRGVHEGGLLLTALRCQIVGRFLIEYAAGTRDLGRYYLDSLTVQGMSSHGATIYAADATLRYMLEKVGPRLLSAELGIMAPIDQTEPVV